MNLIKSVKIKPNNKSDDNIIDTSISFQRTGMISKYKRGSKGLIIFIYHPHQKDSQPSNNHIQSGPKMVGLYSSSHV